MWWGTVPIGMLRILVGTTIARSNTPSLERPPPGITVACSPRTTGSSADCCRREFDSTREWGERESVPRAARSELMTVT